MAYWFDLLDSASHSYDNTTSGLTASTVKLALDEIAANHKVFFPSFVCESVMEAGQVLLRVTFVQDTDFNANWLGSVGHAEFRSVALANIDVRKIDLLDSESSVGTIRFSIGVAAPTFITSGVVSFVKGETMKIVGPAIPDVNLAGVSVTLFGRRV